MKTHKLEPELNQEELDLIYGGTGGIPQWDPATDTYVIVPYNGMNPPLYQQMGGHWVPTGTEPFHL